MMIIDMRLNNIKDIANETEFQKIVEQYVDRRYGQKS